MIIPSRRKGHHCPQCGREFRMAHTGRPKKYCSGRCKWRAWKARQRELERDAKAAGAVV